MRGDCSRVSAAQGPGEGRHRALGGEVVQRPTHEGQQCGEGRPSREAGSAKEVLRHVGQRHEVVCRDGGGGMVEHAVLLTQATGRDPYGPGDAPAESPGLLRVVPRPGGHRDGRPRQVVDAGGRVAERLQGMEREREAAAVRARGQHPGRGGSAGVHDGDARIPTRRGLRGVQGLGEFARNAFECSIRDTEHVEVHGSRMRPHERRYVRGSGNPEDTCGPRGARGGTAGEPDEVGSGVAQGQRE